MASTTQKFSIGTLIFYGDASSSKRALSVNDCPSPPHLGNGIPREEACVQCAAIGPLTAIAGLPQGADSGSRNRLPCRCRTRNSLVAPTDQQHLSKRSETPWNDSRDPHHPLGGRPA